MNTSRDSSPSAHHENGWIVATLVNGPTIRFPVAENPRPSGGTAAQLERIEISPCGLHWPDLDEDLSFHGLLNGNYGQRQEKVVSVVR